jgi:hypothetical protein
MNIMLQNISNIEFDTIILFYFFDILTDYVK